MEREEVRGGEGDVYFYFALSFIISFVILFIYLCHYPCI